jgi:DNA-nicking Smr family endonuclease
MTIKHTPGRGRKRLLSAEDRRLWESVTASVEPLRRVVVAEPAAPANEPPADDSLERTAAPLPARPPQGKRSAPPPLAELNRRTRARLARGNIEIEARLDLHGMTQDRAHGALLRFLRVAQANDARLVLVITGKGARSDDHGIDRERGVLKRVVPQWLSLPELRHYIVGFEPAHIQHGGEGALYVRVRRGRSA